MSIAGLVPASRTQTIDPEAYDHEISLVDSTKTDSEPRGASEDALGSEGGGAPLSRQWTKRRLREELARRRFANWQEDKRASSTERTKLSAEGGSKNGEGSTASQGKRTEMPGGLRDKIPFKARKEKAEVAKTKESYEVDILYENQRGSFLCGIPLYSAKSLLNFDPSGWQTSTFHDSPVDITNAQVPDPSWTWAWRTWYVDMSHDVDEEGWEYSFSFQQGFAWHGSHPWFHSFVRRRRWLRKRVKIHPHRAGEKDGMKAAHLLTAEYFTIHPKRDPSPDSLDHRTSVDRSTYFNASIAESESGEESADITDLVALMLALKRSRLDREKIAAIKNFLEHGGEEIYYLADRTDDILALFVYQTSRRQFQTILLEALEKATETSNNSYDGTTDDHKIAKRREDNLLKAVRAAEIHVNDQDYWSDIRAKTSNADLPDPSLDRDTLDATEPSGDPGKGPEISEKPSTDVGDNIKGIPEDAHVSEEPGIKWNTTPRSPTKGKDEV
ncbi:MAG: hypothetical protein Q9191_003489 [Dirinaria sp. TL-2023a]